MTYDVVKRQGLFVFGQINMMRIKITTGIKHIDMDQRVLIENQINKMKATIAIAKNIPIVPFPFPKICYKMVIEYLICHH